MKKQTVHTLLLVFIMTLWTVGMSLAQCNLNPTVSPGSVMFCPNVPADTLQTQIFQSYQWFIYNPFNQTSTPISGANGQQLVVDPYNYNGYQVFVVVSDGVCTDSSAMVPIDSWVFLPPVVMRAGDAGTIGGGGETYMNCGDTALLILMLPYTENIQWYNYGNPINGAINDTLIVTQTGHYTCSGSPALCPNYLQHHGVVIRIYYPYPTVPVISENNDTLFATGNGVFQWYLNGQPINGANQNTLVPLQNGTYTVTLIDNFQCETESDPFVFNSLSIPNVSNGLVFKVYPNPVQSHVVLENLTQEKQFIQIFNTFGQLMQQTEMMPAEIRTIDMQNYSPGVYLIKGNWYMFSIIRQ